MLERLKEAHRNRMDSIPSRTQEQYLMEAEAIFPGADVDWNKYKEQYPDINMEEIKERVRTSKGWDSIGFHRVLGGIFYDYGLSLIELILGLFLTPLMFLIFIPYPEGNGYYGIASGLFGSLFFIFDFATAFSIERFIGEYRVKNPRKMLGFISFYVWWQMITGLIQITIIAYVACFIVVNNNFAYLSYLFLTLMLVQYPGMTGYFKSILRGLQAFHYDNIVDFLRSNVFDFMTRLIFIVLFRWIGSTNPIIGDLMGLAIGAAIGKEVDEFINMAIAMYFFNKVMKPYGIKARDCFNWRYIDRKIAKTCMWWGFQLSAPGMLGTVWGLLGLFVQLAYLPQLAYWGTVSGVIGMVGTLITIGSKLSIGPGMSEAYMNGKIELAQYYLANAYKWYFTLMWGVLGLLIVLLPEIMAFILTLPGTENYQLVTFFIVPSIINSIFSPLQGYFDAIIVNTDHPTTKAVIEIVGQFTGFTWHVFTYVFLQWQFKFGIHGIVMIYTFAGFANWLAFFFIKWIFIEFYVFHVSFPKWQSIIAPIITTLTGILPIGYLWLYGIYRPILIPGFTALFASMGIPDPVLVGGIVAAAITLLMALLVFLFLVYLPLLAFWGGWDDYGLLVFRRAYHLSGPSKWLIYLLYKGTMLGVRLSKRFLKLHGKYPVPAQIPYLQTMELMVEREIHDIITGFTAGKVAASTGSGEEVVPAEMKPPRFYLTELLTDFKRFFTQTTGFQKRGIAFCAVLYFLMLSPLALMPLGSAFFTPTIVWITWGSYVGATAVVGFIAITFAIRYVTTHDMKDVYSKHLKQVMERNALRQLDMR
nr:hypothetical protein [Candidatus Sigynarchaeum springense]